MFTFREMVTRFIKQVFSNREQKKSTEQQVKILFY